MTSEVRWPIRVFWADHCLISIRRLAHMDGAWMALTTAGDVRRSAMKSLYSVTTSGVLHARTHVGDDEFPRYPAKVPVSSI